jgi:hypothetical protein
MATNSDWIRGEQIIEKLNRVDLELFNKVQAGHITPYDAGGNQLVRPDVSTKRNELAALQEELKTKQTEFENNRFGGMSLIDGPDSFVLSAWESRMRDLQNRIKEIDPEIKAIKKFLNETNPYSWGEFSIPQDSKEMESFFKLLSNAIFRVTEYKMLLDKKTKKDKGNIDAKQKNVTINSGSSDEIQPATDNSTGQYVFRKTGPSWEIIFEGRKISGLQGKGFKCLHYLVSRPGSDFSVLDLNQLDGNINFNGNTKSRAAFSEEKRNESEEIKNSNRPSGGTFHQEDIADKRYLYELKNKWQQLRIALADAEREGDPDAEEQAKIELEKLGQYIPETISFNGKSKKTRNEATRSKERIGKRISRAIDKIVEYDKKAAEHFKKAIPAINSYSLSYTPEETPDWTLE